MSGRYPDPAFKDQVSGYAGQERRDAERRTGSRIDAGRTQQTGERLCLHIARGLREPDDLGPDGFPVVGQRQELYAQGCSRRICSKRSGVAMQSDCRRLK